MESTLAPQAIMFLAKRTSEFNLTSWIECKFTVRCRTPLDIFSLAHCLVQHKSHELLVSDSVHCQSDVSLRHLHFTRGFWTSNLKLILFHLGLDIVLQTLLMEYVGAASQGDRFALFKTGVAYHTQKVSVILCVLSLCSVQSFFLILLDLHLKQVDFKLAHTVHLLHQLILLFLLYIWLNTLWLTYSAKWKCSCFVLPYVNLILSWFNFYFGLSFLNKLWFNDGFCWHRIIITLILIYFGFISYNCSRFWISI
jgi:hypothetical protein